MKKKRIIIFITIILCIAIIFLGFNLYKSTKAYAIATENSYNMAFYELVDYTQNVKIYLAKSLITRDKVESAETLTYIWREANLAQTYLSMLPIESQELEKVAKFLNQVSDYSFSLSRKSMQGKDLSEEELKNLTDLYNYSLELSNVLNQLAMDIDSGRLKWKELQKKENHAFAQQVDNITKDSFSNLEENFHEYSGLIYDGAYSEHMSTREKVGLTGDDIDQEKALNIARDFLGNNFEVTENGLSENTEISSYIFSAKKRNDYEVNLSVSKRGGHIVYMNSTKTVNSILIEEKDAIESANNFLNSKGFPNMTYTYYLIQNGIITINYAYKQDNVTIYPDLIKVKVALDNGEVIGIETSGFLNCHHERKIPEAKITIDEAKEKLNSNLNIISSKLVIIPTEWATEIFCYEFQGKINEIDFLAYINAENGNAEDVLIITNTLNGTITE